MRRISYMITGLITVFSIATITAFAKPDWPIDTRAQSGADIAMDMNPGAVLFAQNIHEQRAPASITKLLTALVVIEDTDDPDVPVTFPHDATYSVESGAGNKFNLEEGDVLSVRQYFCAMLFQSSSQSANTLVEYVAGSRQTSVDVMNQKVEELGCNESHFTNPSGLSDDTQRTMAYDIAIIAEARFQNPAVLEIASARTSPVPATANNPNGRTFFIEYKMLSSDGSDYYPDAIAGKTDWISQARQTLITYARREGRGQIAVTLMSTRKTHYSDTKTILDFCFAKFRNVSIVDNEIEYVTGNAPVAIGVGTYNPSEFFIGSEATITISNDAQFTSANKTLETDLPEGHPQEAVARLVCTYNEYRVGGAWIYSSSVQAVNAIPFEPDGDTPPESQSTEDGQEGNTGFTLPKAVFIGGGVVLVLALFVGGEVFWLERRQATEREHQHILRERYRQHLVDIGYTGEGFGRLLDGRRKQHDVR